ncbi:hypothetical protein Mgra_00004187 [Meloidogyne graminicola]|uniref:Golgi SNAP receptor complex member 1 n=1 Tax=Meloidogyne graminicola TaxID=189291 RepID=A0A8S9ZTD0_9BILA|nr:hypothetical protein Mgra_00004187 [Meloidogyne graminicola]
MEDLQRKARLLENEIDMRLISLNKFHMSNTGQTDIQNKTHSRRAFDSLTGEIESKLSKLSEINYQMQECFDKDKDVFNKTPQQHILRRHQDILRDYSAEFRRTHENIKNQLQRDELMEITSTVNNRCRTTDYLTRENESISDCDRLLNDQISIAMSVREGLYSQSSGLGTINKRVHHLTKKYPAINNLMNKIRMKKRKDTLILAAVISTCLIFIFIYIMH